jgi:hypothetical protein
MKKTLVISLLTLFIMSSCYYGVNEKTSQIAWLNNICQSNYAFDTIVAKNPVCKIKDSLFLNALVNFKDVTFPVSLIYLNQEPKEIIGFDYYSIRYVFNPKIDSTMNLDGLSPKLNDSEKKRIRNRVQKLIMEYQCDVGKKESEKLMAE